MAGAEGYDGLGVVDIQKVVPAAVILHGKALYGRIAFRIYDLTADLYSSAGCIRGFCGDGIRPVILRYGKRKLRGIFAGL